MLRDDLDPLTREVWRPIRDYVGYEVSSFGRCRSFWGKGGESRGRRGLVESPKIIGGYVQARGHLQVAIYRPGDMKPERFAMHAMVLEAFVGPRPPGLVCCHCDGNPANNRIDNLRWDTYKANSVDMAMQGRGGGQALQAHQIPEIWAAIVAGEGLRRIARRYGVSDGAISSIKAGRCWSHITKDLPGYPLVAPDAREPVFVPAEVADSAEELWRIVPDYPAYRVSSWGKVQTRWRRVRGKEAGRGTMEFGEWAPKALSADKDGYRITQIRNDGGAKMAKVHALVLTTFAGPKPPGMFACHADGDRANNRASNLRWDTARANAIDRVAMRGR